MDYVGPFFHIIRHLHDTNIDCETNCNRRLTYAKQRANAVGGNDNDEKTSKNIWLSSLINEAKRYLPINTTNLHCN
jgi:hypothetical protein